MGPYEGLAPLFIFLAGLSAEFCCLSDLRTSADQRTVLRFRVASTVERIIAMIVWIVLLLGLFTS